MVLYLVMEYMMMMHKPLEEFSSYCGGLHVMVYLVDIWIGKEFYLFLSFVIQDQG
jgi:hypothetical protein